MRRSKYKWGRNHQDKSFFFHYLVFFGSQELIHVKFRAVWLPLNRKNSPFIKLHFLKTAPLQEYIKRKKKKTFTKFHYDKFYLSTNIKCRNFLKISHGLYKYKS